MSELKLLPSLGTLYLKVDYPNFMHMTLILKSIILDIYDNSSSPSFDMIQQALVSLGKDKDHDVREAAAQDGRVKACPPPPSEPEQCNTVPDNDNDEDKDESQAPTWAQIVETEPTPSTQTED